MRIVAEEHERAALILESDDAEARACAFDSFNLHPAGDPRGGQRCDCCAWV
jgi:hypothetical protein